MRPAPQEYSPFYAGYVNNVPDGDIVSFLEQQGRSFVRFLGNIPRDRRDFSYDEGKWTIAQVVQHVIDSERVFAYRLLRIARRDTTPMPGFDQDTWAVEATGTDRTLDSLANEFESVRASTMTLLRSLKKEQLPLIGIANDTEISIRAIAWIIAGHTEHHREILNERYLS